MGLWEEAFRLKDLAEQYLERGNLDKAINYLELAIKNVDMLIAKEIDAGKKKIYMNYKKRLLRLLEDIKKNPEKFLARREEILQRVSAGRDRVSVQGTSRQKVLSKREVSPKVMGKRLPNVCKSGAFSIEIPEITFNDVAGFEELKKELKEAIEWQIKYPELIRELKIKPLKGILLYGPPGTGKTYIVKAAAGEFKIPVILADPATIMSKYVGESEKVVRDIFACARSIAPTIVFVDEVDKLLPLQTSGSDAPKRVEAQFLIEMDGFKSDEGFIVVFATNEPWNISPALIRPGRVDRIIYVPPPDREARIELFRIYLRGIPGSENLDYEKLADLTEPNAEGYYSASGIAQICNEAKRILLRKWTETGEKVPITMDDIIKAIEKIPRSISHKMVKEYESWGLQFSSFR